MIMKLPPLDNTIDWKNYHIDATPDGRYALRILKLYRERAKSKWILSGLSDGEMIIYNYMNDDQDKRIEELDKAIEILRKELK